jgi:lipopolysaccharide export system protein LptC
MRKWSSALLPLSILLVLVALTTWLRYVTEFPEVRNDGRNRHDPDYIISDVRGRKLDTAGNLLYILTADEIRHYPDDDTTDLLKPTLIYLDPKRPPVSIHSVHGHTSSQAERIELWEQVEIHRAATAKDGPLVATMSELTVLCSTPSSTTAIRLSSGSMALMSILFKGNLLVALVAGLADDPQERRDTAGRAGECCHRPPCGEHGCAPRPLHRAEPLGRKGNRPTPSR